MIIQLINKLNLLFSKATCPFAAMGAPSTLLIISCLAVLSLLSSCYRDDLCFDHPQGAYVELKIDWTRSKLQPNAATALIYKDNQLYRTEIISTHPPVSKIIQLPLGTYSILVFDEMEPDYENSLSFENKESWDNFTLRSIDDLLKKRQTRATSDPLKSHVDTMAVDRVVNFEITQEMVNHVHVDPTPKSEVDQRNHLAATINFVPRRVFTIADIVLRVKNGRGYYFTTTSPAYMHGTSESYSPTTHKYSTYQVAHPVKFTAAPTFFDANNNNDVTWLSTLHVIGLTDYNDPDIPIGAFDYILTLPFQAAGGIKQQIDIDLVREAKEFTHRAEDPDDPNHNWDHLYIEIELELPPLANMDGFQAEVEDWTDVDIPLDGPARLIFMSNNGSNEVFQWPNLPGITINLPEPLFTPVDGLKFKCWSTNANGDEPLFYSGQEFETKRGGTLFYAIWEADDLPLQTLTFHANDGTNETVSSRQKPGVLLPLPPPLFKAPAGKSFKNWNSRADGTGTAYLPDDKFRVRRQNENFYAIWQ